MPIRITWFSVDAGVPGRATQSRTLQKRGATRCRRDDGHLRRIFRVAARPTGATRRIPPHEIPGAAVTHLYPTRMPLKRLQDIPGHNSLELTQLNILEDETAINRSHSPLVPLMG
ncbi:hypothetical protein TBK1r_39600 [Stieleria magnilauensis]|uniref:Uncharacterized protein n=1 Tax=Stieleria magnilauensis TaxID=2527963 RepID=A0ABX5XSM7_9BACT|nr:hypothetical protein TBK1r_39600 [Planctomycetes bacterium TBK1r]